MERLPTVLKTFESPLWVHGAIFVLVTCYFAIRQFWFSGLSADEAEQVLFAQAFQWGYDIANPPLYTWIVIGAFTLFGKSAAVAMAIKYLAVAGIYVAMYWAARLCLGERRKLDHALVALSPVLFFLVGWHSIFNFSHSLLNGLFAVVTFIAFVQVVKHGAVRWYLVLGVVVGLGALTKYSYLIFFAALMLAGVSMAEFRRHVLSWKMAAALVLAVVIVLPHAHWMMGEMDRIEQVVNYKLQISQDASYVSGVAKGGWNFLRAAFAFMSPMWLVVLVLFAPLLGKRAPQGDAVQQNAIARLLGRTFLAIIVIVLGMIVVGGVSQFRPNYLFMMVLFPLWVFLRLPEEERPGKRRVIYGATVLVTGLLSVAGLGVKAVADPLTCNKCQYLMPYEEIAEALRARGLDHGTLFAHWHPVALPGNLALHLDGVRVISSKFPHIKPPSNPAPGTCAMVWVPNKSGGALITNWSGLANDSLGTNIQSNTQFHEQRFPIRHAPDKGIFLRFVTLDPGVGDCI